MKQFWAGFLSACVVLIVAGESRGAERESPVEHRIGVLAKRGETVALRKWSATAEYLTRAIPGHRFQAVPLGFDAIFRAARERRVDFVLANPAIYVAMEARFGASPLATLRNRTGQGEVDRFGGVVFTRADNGRIRRLADLAGRSFMAVDPDSLGGFLMVRRLLKQRGLSPEDFRGLSFGGTHDAVVEAVARGRVAAGTVRTDTLERMAAEGRIERDEFRILHRQDPAGFPFGVTTRLYPEWPFAQLPHASRELVRQVAVSLLRMPPDHAAAVAGSTRGWTVPRNYQPVHALLHELRLAPYDQAGPIVFRDILRQYGEWLAGGAALLLALALSTLYFLRLNRRLRTSQAALREARDRLEERVAERTAQLAASERKYRGIIDGTREGFFALDSEEGYVVEVNTALCRLLGYERAELLGTAPDALLADPAMDAFARAFAAEDDAARPTFEAVLRAGDGEAIPVLVHANRGESADVPDYAFLTDLRAFKQAERSLQRANRALEVLSTSNRALLHAQDQTDLLEQVCRLVVEEGGYPAAWVAREPEAADGLETVARGEARPGLVAALEDLCGGGDGCPLEGALQHGEPVVLRGLDDNPDSTAWAREAARLGMAAVAVLPMHNECLRGVLVLFAAEGDAFDPGEARLLHELAQDLAFGIRDLRIRAEREEHLHRLRQSAAVFDSSAEGVIITDPHERIVAVNPAFTAITGYREDEVLGGTPRMLSSGSQDRSFYQAMWQELRDSGVWKGEVWNRRKSGEVYPEYLTISAVHDATGTLTNYVAVFADISEVKRSQQELDFLANHDPLTELPNRRLFNDRLDHALARVARDDEALAVLFLDLDEFKNVNDSLGHPVGDQLLQQVAQRLLGRVRQTDTLARIGGDEFLLLLEAIGGPEEAELVTRDILDAFQAPFHLAGQEISLGASMGISVYPEDGTDTETLVKNADAALFRAKGEGRNQFCYYTRELTESAAERLQMERELASAVENDELVLHFQPKVDLSTGAIQGAEALVRWHHPERGMVSPAKFIPLAEETGLILPIGEWVLRHACRQVCAWAEAGLLPGRVAVNISAVQLQRQEVPGLVERVASEEGCPLNRLELEVTEASIMQDTAVSASSLSALRAQGVELSLDDFGTGYSSLGYLKNLPLDTLKIDKSFVQDVPEDASDTALVRTILGMGQSLGMNVVAEGVETEEQAGFLLTEGCGGAQGFLYARPLPADEFESLMRQ